MVLGLPKLTARTAWTPHGRRVSAMRFAVRPENGAAAVAALDRAIEIVPLVGPADGDARSLAAAWRFAERELAEIREDAVERAAIAAAGDHVAFDGECIRREIAGANHDRRLA